MSNANQWVNVAHKRKHNVGSISWYDMVAFWMINSVSYPFYGADISDIINYNFNQLCCQCEIDSSTSTCDDSFTLLDKISLSEKKKFHQVARWCEGTSPCALAPLCPFTLAPSCPCALLLLWLPTLVPSWTCTLLPLYSSPLPYSCTLLPLHP